MGEKRKGNPEYLAYGLNHIAMIMDGNGRWAKRRGLPRLAGHKQGVETVRSVVEECGDIGIPFLTLYSFSTENWQRPVNEVQGLMDLFLESIDRFGPELHKKRVRVRFIGRREGLPESLIRQMGGLEQLTEKNTDLTLNLALNYGGRDELIRSFLRFLNDASRPANGLNEAVFRTYLDTGHQPDPDMLIRTAGEKRLSNFLLWQVAYSELWFTDTLWPDFTVEHLHDALNDFVSRKRKFGGLG
ncbi:MAG: polyprenyl diphosphate synthase [Candidatus Atribacteria bacterium]|nr:polyprenyl diphosphate synthase [Candidatus Atribacteria bacterium]